MTSTRTGPARTFVLVHGAAHGGWCYRPLAALLTAQGHRVFTPTLSGLAERSRENVLPINLTTHIDNILDLFTWEELEDVVLVGHSYGGMVITGVADAIPEKIRTLVYLDAVRPDNGTCMAEYVWPGEALLQVLAVVGSLGGGTMLPAMPNSGEFFNVNEADRAWVDRRCTAHPMATLLEKINLGTAHETIANQAYVYAANSGIPPLKLQFEQAKARPGWKTFEVAAGHDIMIDAPQRLVEILDELG